MQGLCPSGGLAFAHVEISKATHQKKMEEPLSYVFFQLEKGNNSIGNWCVDKFEAAR